MIPQQLYLKPEEGKFLAMAVMSTLDQFKETIKNPKLNWTPDARKTLKEMIEAGDKLKLKLEKLGFDMRDLPPFLPTDINDFFTKPS